MEKRKGEIQVNLNYVLMPFKLFNVVTLKQGRFHRASQLE